MVLSLYAFCPDLSDPGPEGEHHTSGGCEALGVGAGDFILLERTDKGTFELIPATLVPTDQLWFHHPDMRSRVTRAEDDFEQGRSTRTETPEQAQAFLDGLKKKPSSHQQR
ncbi:MAG TPA: hypothetical protein VFE33_30590 [Thermoanaerobaculia bacterium]|nr:hypothetical protein [Thermoanaerobaculia bacterium]